MNIVVINGTEWKGSTFQMKEIFLEAMGDGHHIIDHSLPQDFPVICEDCKICACKGLNACPHASYTVPLWESILVADLLVFTLPSYASDVPVQIQALLDHYYAKFMAHSLEAKMFNKQAVVITREAGLMINKNTHSVKSSLDDWGLMRTHSIKQPSLQICWYYVSDKGPFQLQCERVVSKINKWHKRKSLL